MKIATAQSDLDGAARDPLDDLLDATDPAPHPAAVRRLEVAWTRATAPHTTPQYPWWRTATVAACLLVSAGVGTGYWATRRHTTAPPPIAIKPIEPVKVPRTLARAPSPGERLLVVTATREQKLISRRRTQAAIEPTEPPPASEALYATLASPRTEERRAAAMALGAQATPADIQRLAHLARQPGRRRDAVAALMASPLPEAAAVLDQPDLTGERRSLAAQNYIIKSEPKPGSPPATKEST